MVMVKPGGAYLDIIRDVKEQVGGGVFPCFCVFGRGAGGGGNSHVG